MKLKNFILSVVLLFGVNLYAVNKFNVYELKDANNKKVVITETVDGLEFTTSKGKIVLLNFFGKTCPPCLMEIPHLIKLKKKYKKSFDILAFQVQGPMGKKSLDNFIKTKLINYTVIDGDQTYNFVEFVMAKTGWEGMIPFMVLFDKKGNPAKMYVGMRSEEEIEADIKNLL